MDKLLVIQVAALGDALVNSVADDRKLAGLRLRRLQPPFPAVTCTAQASFRTGVPAAGHGIVGNGFYSRDLHRVYFWEQSSALMQGPRIWDEWRARGRTVGQMFWQHSLGTDSDLIISPAPIHKHGGGMIQDCFSAPSDLYPHLCEVVGRRFNLLGYWGPLTSHRSSRWICAATSAVMTSRWAPDLLLTYLPHLDYSLQKNGPDAAGTAAEYAVVSECVESLATTARSSGYHTLIFGDYAIGGVTRAVLPNRILQEAGLLHTRRIRGMQYLDTHRSAAFAVVDHQIAHVICQDEAAREAARARFEHSDGVGVVLDQRGKADWHIDHDRAGDLVLVAEEGWWFAYPWWGRAGEAPDYARHVDIHSKPGYDPCELFFGRTPFEVSLNTERVRGSHGLVSPATEAVYGTDLDLAAEPDSLIDLATAVQAWMNQH